MRREESCQESAKGGRDARSTAGNRNASRANDFPAVMNLSLSKQSRPGLVCSDCRSSHPLTAAPGAGDGVAACTAWPS